MKEYTNHDEGITSLVWEMTKGIAVALRDDESGETLDPVTIFPHKMENAHQKAHSHALKIANLNP
jgi:hypothetical protein